MLEAGKAYHPTFNLVWVLRQSDADLSGILQKGTSGHPLSASEVVEMCVAALRAGLDVMPVCDNHDERGYCLGHPVEDKSHEPVTPGQDHTAPGISAIPAAAGNRDEATQGEAAGTEQETKAG